MGTAEREIQEHTNLRHGECWPDENTLEVTQGDLTNQLYKWWLKDSEAVAVATVAKMAEYGSGDLVAIGRQITQMAGREQGTSAQAMELGCMFYLLGKVARLTSAVEDDRTPSDDTWFDIEVYAKMVRAARAGAWPLPE